MSVEKLHEPQPFSIEQIRDARDQMFPGWWMYKDAYRPPEWPAPFYRVVCQNQEEFDLASAARPANVRVEIVLHNNPQPTK